MDRGVRPSHETAKPSALQFAPRLPTALAPRDDLIARLDAPSVPLVIVRAPAGGGKTTLLASWATRPDRPGVWVALDESATRRLGFWRRVVSAVVDARLVAEDSDLAQLVIAGEVAETLRPLLLRGFATLPEPIAIVLDEYQQVTDPLVHDDLHWLLRSGARLRVLIGTRARTDLEEPDRLARVDTTVLLAEDLVFDATEVEHAASALGLDAPTAAVIHGAFEGWPLPTRAALIELSTGRAQTVRQAVERVRAIDERGPALDETDPAYVRFLLRASIASRLGMDLAARLDADAATHLAHAEHDGLGTWAHADDAAWFVFHPYLRQGLERRLLATLPDEVAGLRAAYARERAAHGDPLEAARQYAAVGDLNGIVSLVRRFYGDLLWVHTDEIVAILEAADPARLRQHPELLTVLLLTRTTDGAPRLGLLQLASLILAQVQARMGGDPVERTMLLLSQLAVQRLSGHYEQAVHTAARLADVAGALDGNGRHALAGVLPSAWIQAATTFLYAGEWGRAAELLRFGLEAGRAIERPWAEVHATGLQLLIPAMRGDLAALAPALDDARTRRRPQGWRGTYTAAGYHLAEAWLALEQFDAAGVLRHLADLEPHEATIEHWPLIAALRAQAALGSAPPQHGLDALAAAVAAHESRPPISGSMTTMLAATRADLLLADRQPHRAAEALRAVRREPGARMPLARIELLLGNNDRVIRLAAPMAWTATHTPRTKAEALLTLGIASARLGREREARDAALAALDVLQTAALRRPLMSAPRSELVALLHLADMDSDSLLDGIPETFPDTGGAPRLTPAELRVLEHLQLTGRIDEIADALYLSTNTVKSQLRRAYRKLGVRSREEALGVAYFDGILDPARLKDRGSAAG